MTAVVGSVSRFQVCRRRRFGREGYCYQLGRPSVLVLVLLPLPSVSSVIFGDFGETPYDRRLPLFASHCVFDQGD